MHVVAFALSPLQLGSERYGVCDDRGPLFYRFEPESFPLLDLHAESAEVEGDSLCVCKAQQLIHQGELPR